MVILAINKECNGEREWANKNPAKIFSAGFELQQPCYLLGLFLWGLLDHAVLHELLLGHHMLHRGMLGYGMLGYGMLGNNMFNRGIGDSESRQ